MTTFLTAKWRNLIMANYEVNPEILKKYLPYQTELDTWNGIHYVSLVGFMFLDTKILGIKVPFHVNFEEVNLRFYVRHKEDGEWKRGVVFIKEIVPKPTIALVANSLYGEKYITLKMKNDMEQTSDNLSIGYFWKFQNQWNSLQATTATHTQAIEEGSEAEFITEHYWGYTKLKNEQTSQYQVEHPRWQVYPVQSYEINCNFEALYGDDFESLTYQKPLSVLMAQGSEVAVRKGKEIK
jgi:uncharacterized protein YqjF (DUF2071 family)